MSDWYRKHVPAFCERLIGFSVPKENKVLVISYEATHTLHLGDEVTVETHPEFGEYEAYDPESGLALYDGNEYSIVGLHGGNPLTASPLGEQLALDTARQMFSVTRGDEVLFSDRYENFSGDWAVATLSPDGMYIVLGCPYDFDFRVYQRYV